MNKHIELIELLRNHPYLDIDKISDSLNVSRADAWNLIHQVNKGKKYTLQNIKIVRSGKYGKSMYSLVSNDTVPLVILKNLNRHVHSCIHHVRRERELGLVSQNTVKMKENLEEIRNLIIQANNELNTLWNEAYYATSLPVTRRKKVQNVA